MKRISIRKNRVIIAAAPALAVVTVGTAAGAAVLAGSVDGAGVIHACYYAATSAGSHRVVLQNAGRKCPTGSTAISWNRVGRTGPRGPQGLRGLPGPQGQQGQPGPAGSGGLLPSQLTFGVGVPEVLSATRYRFSEPDQVAFDGSHLWIADLKANTLTAIQGP